MTRGRQRLSGAGYALGALWLALGWSAWATAAESASGVHSAWRSAPRTTAPATSGGASAPAAATAASVRSATESTMSTLPLNAEYAFSATVKVAAPTVMGTGPDGLRRFIAITGGTAGGPAFTGKVLEGSGDWQIVRSDGVISLEARYTLESTDGVRIAITNKGMRDASPAVTERIMRGDPVAPNEYYFRTVAFVEAPMGSKYEWMNRRLFIGIAERKSDAAVVHFYTLN
jgi:hypothetical protein